MVGRVVVTMFCTGCAARVGHGAGRRGKCTNKMTCTCGKEMTNVGFHYETDPKTGKQVVIYHYRCSDCGREATKRAS